MQASELIAALEDLVKQHGDLQIVMDNDTEPTVEKSLGWRRCAGDFVTPFVLPNPVGWEAECSSCGETFNPHDEHDLVHCVREDGEECGGLGELKGCWW